MMNEKNEAIMVRIWGIRDAIEVLERVKDVIITYWNEVAGSDGSNSMWVSDVKEMYYSVTSAWTMLKGSLKKKEYVATSSKYLNMARSRMEQVASELQTEKNKKTTTLETRLRQAFEPCWEEIDIELQNLEPKPLEKPPSTKVAKKDATTYALPCAKCGNNGIVFLLRPSPKTKKLTLYYSGVLVDTTFTQESAKKIFAWLDDKNLADVHEYLKKGIQTEEGMDGYCPKCDKVYCEDHYDLREVFDQGFYDCTYGTCPQDHERIIHD